MVCKIWNDYWWDGQTFHAYIISCQIYLQIICAHTHTYTCKHTLTHIIAHTITHILAHTHSHTYLPTHCTITHILAHTHSHTYLHTHSHTYLHTHTTSTHMQNTEVHKFIYISEHWLKIMFKSLKYETKTIMSLKAKLKESEIYRVADIKIAKRYFEIWATFWCNKYI